MKLENALSKKAQGESPTNSAMIETYFDSLFNLVITSQNTTNNTEEMTEALPNDSEVSMGMEYSAEATIVLSGDVKFPFDASDEDVKNKIANDFAEEVWLDREDCRQVAEDLKSDMHGVNTETTAHAEIISLAKNADRTYSIVMQLIISVTGNESNSDMQSRFDDERGDERLGLLRDEG